MPMQGFFVGFFYHQGKHYVGSAALREVCSLRTLLVVLHHRHGLDIAITLSRCVCGYVCRGVCEHDKT